MPFLQRGFTPPLITCKKIFGKTPPWNDYYSFFVRNLYLTEFRTVGLGFFLQKLFGIYQYLMTIIVMMTGIVGVGNPRLAVTPPLLVCGWTAENFSQKQKAIDDIKV